MNTYTYIYPLSATPESNETLIAKQVIRVLDCSSNITTNNQCDLWTYTKCSVDKDYCNPFIVGDKIYLQLHGQQGYYGPILYKVMNAETHEEITSYYDFVTVENGTDENLKGYINVIIDTSSFVNVNCFYLQIKAYRCNIAKEDQVAFYACVDDLIAQGETPNSAAEICLSTFCDGATIDEIYSEPFCKIKCDLPSILLEGEYTKYDCEGQFYGKFSSGSATNSYKNQIRILGEIIPNEFNIEETLISSTIRRGAKLIESHNLRGHEKIPYYVAKKISNIFASKYVYVDGVKYNGALKLSKNMEVGNMWIIDENLTQSCDNDFTCD